MPSKQHLVATVPPEAVRALEPGVTCMSVPSSGAGALTPILIYSRLGGSVDRACRNRCAHQAGRFVPDLEDLTTAKCTSHGWRLHVATMRYLDPPELRNQEEFRLQSCEDGACGLWEEEPEEPWKERALTLTLNLTLTLI